MSTQAQEHNQLYEKQCRAIQGVGLSMPSMFGHSGEVTVRHCMEGQQILILIIKKYISVYSRGLVSTTLLQTRPHFCSYFYGHILASSQYMICGKPSLANGHICRLLVVITISTAVTPPAPPQDQKTAKIKNVNKEKNTFDVIRSWLETGIKITQIYFKIHKLNCLLVFLQTN